MTIGYDKQAAKAVPAGDFRLADVVGFGVPERNLPP